MASLTSCIKKAGKALSRDDADQIREIQQDLISDGVPAVEASEQAIEEYLNTMNEELQDFVSQAQAQGAQTEDQLSYFGDRGTATPRDIDPGPLSYRMEDEVVEEIDSALPGLRWVLSRVRTATQCL